jgi:GR25 family glycosyltransferase involved in LPS biosynthesis
MIFTDAPKFVVNLERRKDRLDSIKKEMEYIGWDYEYFPAVDTNSHVGCTRSHLEIIKLAKERNYEKVLIVEDDCTIMPYAKSMIEQIENESEGFEFAVVNLAPTINRPVNLSTNFKWFLDITNLPPKQEHHRGIFATNMIMYHNSIYDKVLEIEDPSKIGYYAIDDFIYQFITSKYQSYIPIVPIGPQISDWSDVSHGIYNNFYTQTYNWNLYSPKKIPNTYLNLGEIKKLKDENLHKDFSYES